ncbi:MAG: 30S ribosomal protein S3 [Bdellovibrionota bacterium]
MGQKVHPKGLRLGIIEGWLSKWFSADDMAKFIGEDEKVRNYVKLKLHTAGISKIEIERTVARIKLNIHSAKPGLVIGKKGKDIDDLRKHLKKIVGKDVVLNIIEARKPDMDAKLVAESVAYQLEKRANYRKVAKDAVNKAMRMGAEGIKISVGGRLNGADIARTEQYKEGRIPLHTLRAEIDYATARANTTYGVIGIKVWIFKGVKYSKSEQAPVEAMQL